MPNVTVLNDSGKVIKNGKFLTEVFKDARAAYRERKAEIKAIRKSSLDEVQTRRALDRLEVGDGDHEYRSPISSRRSSVQSSVSTRRPHASGSARPERPRVDSRRSSYASTSTYDHHEHHDHRERRERRDYRHRDDRDGRDYREHRDHRPVDRTPTSLRQEKERRVRSSSSHSHQSIPLSPQSPRSRKGHGRSRLRFEDSVSDFEDEKRGKELVRRNTDGMIFRSHHDTADSDNDGHSRRSSRRSSTITPSSPRLDRSRRDEHARAKTNRSASMSEMEMSLAYGNMPPGVNGALSPAPEERELRGQIRKLQRVLDEAHCMESSVKAMIERLAKNPDQLAAAALMLGEISTLVAKAGPAALSSLKVSAPAVFALLAAPEFAIAAGVGVGVTVIALGGYKIVKRMKRKKAAKELESGNREGKALADNAYEEEVEDEELAPDELQEIRSDLSRIEIWRRGIADVHMDSSGTSVDGEFITPVASKQLIREGKLKESDLKSSKSSKKEDRKTAKAEAKRLKDSDETGSVLERGKAFIRDPNGLRSLFKSEPKPPKLPARPEPSMA